VPKDLSFLECENISRVPHNSGFSARIGWASTEGVLRLDSRFQRPLLEVIGVPTTAHGTGAERNGSLGSRCIALRQRRTVEPIETLPDRENCDPPVRALHESDLVGRQAHVDPLPRFASIASFESARRSPYPSVHFVKEVDAVRHPLGIVGDVQPTPVSRISTRPNRPSSRPPFPC